MLQISFWNILFTVINLLILYWLVKKFLFKPVHKVLAAREAEIKKQYADAAAKEQEAEALKQQYEASVAEMNDAKAAALKEAKRQASAEYDRMLQSARAESARVIAGAKDKAAAAAKEERRKANAEILAMVRSATGDMTAAQRDEQVYDAFLKEVGAAAPVSDGADQ